jgi:isoaspartyl peptidase/L-asparaginase-like protein (Ntn-hydrolase superfamily)
VAYIRKFEHPISIARAVMEDSPHVLLVGEGAERFALARGFETAELLSEESRREWEEWRAQQAKPGPEGVGATLVANIEEQGKKSHDTIGVLAIDGQGVLAGACSTSGISYKLPGRVGDSPIVGHAMYVEPGVGAAVATGHGELVMSVCGSFLAVEMLRRGAGPEEAAREVLRRIRQTQALTEQDQVGMIVLRADGMWGGAGLKEGFVVAVRDEGRDEVVSVKSE